MKIKKFKSVVKNNPKGDVIKLFNSFDKYLKFKGEAYISKIKKKKIKAWKLHLKANLNLFIIDGKIKFVTVDKKNKFNVNILDAVKLNRIFIPRGTIFGFQNMANKESLILSISDIVYDKKESQSYKISDYEFNWIK